MPRKNKNESELSAEDFGINNLVRVLTGYGDPPDPLENKTVSWLSMAIHDGDYDFAKHLLEHGANPNFRHACGTTPIWDASYQGAIHYAEDGNTILASDPPEKIIRLLIQHGGDVESCNPFGSTGLMQAAEHGNLESVRAFLEAGANVDARNRDGYTALDCAASVMIGQVSKESKSLSHSLPSEIIALLVAYGASVTAPPGHFSPLHRAAQSGNLNGARALLAAGASVNDRGPNGRTPLVHCALIVPNIRHRERRQPTNPPAELIDLLAAHGADVNAQGNDGWTALMLASEVGDLDAILALLRPGADPNLQASDGRTALMCAAMHGYNPNRAYPASKVDGSKVLRALIRHGADLEKTLQDGRTALMIAAREDRFFAVRALAKAGADVNARDAQGRTVLMYAAMIDAKCVPMPQNILDGSAHPEEDLWEDVRDRITLEKGGESLEGIDACLAVVRVLMKYGADRNATDRQGHSLITYAARTSSVFGGHDVFDYLCDLRAEDWKRRRVTLSAPGESRGSR